MVLVNSPEVFQNKLGGLNEKRSFLDITNLPHSIITGFSVLRNNDNYNAYHYPDDYHNNHTFSQLLPQPPRPKSQRQQ
jgi:hypothetical protein